LGEKNVMILPLSRAAADAARGFAAAAAAGAAAAYRARFTFSSSWTWRIALINSSAEKGFTRNSRAPASIERRR